MSLDRFVEAQDQDWPSPVLELRNGRKLGHWMWYVFPQIAGLGRTKFAMTYAIADLDEAQAYLAHPVLGPRLIEVCEAMMSVDGKTAVNVLGSIDALKLQSCATLFQAAGGGEIFGQILSKFYLNQPCPQTLKILGKS
ncbi:hypothetical protein PEL8287_03113 [Roseovarius litorisediminis]|uniref:Calpastatin n=1 Tax=Roseovarius litorisediminis TaxID=1312363 RepID=A0A1Y5T8H7_9RHOB|nr:DUF1810 domain-containing protein [Roseovarius litorisediminis]SLN57788.1 hypothetical protein PEL8287_03113 [Roseovarius litorisediminis]